MRFLFQLLIKSTLGIVMCFLYSESLSAASLIILAIQPAMLTANVLMGIIILEITDAVKELDRLQIEAIIVCVPMELIFKLIIYYIFIYI